MKEQKEYTFDTFVVVLHSGRPQIQVKYKMEQPKIIYTGDLGVHNIDDYSDLPDRVLRRRVYREMGRRMGTGNVLVITGGELIEFHAHKDHGYEIIDNCNWLRVKDQ